MTLAPPNLTPEGLALTHNTAFDGKGWSEADFRGYLSDPSALIFGNDTCFAVVRLMAAEAEVLTLATRPTQQNRGRATAMLRSALSHLGKVGVQEVFLDVSDQNTAARALYARCGFTSFALRHNYYKNGTTAICMKAVL